MVFTSFFATVLCTDELVVWVGVFVFCVAEFEVLVLLETSEAADAFKTSLSSDKLFCLAIFPMKRSSLMVKANANIAITPIIWTYFEYLLIIPPPSRIHYN